MIWIFTLMAKIPVALQRLRLKHCQNWAPRPVRLRLSLKHKEMSHWWDVTNKGWFGRINLKLNQNRKQNQNCWLCRWCWKSLWPKEQLRARRRRALPMFHPMLLGFAMFWKSCQANRNRTIYTYISFKHGSWGFECSQKDAHHDSASFQSECSV